MDTQGLNRPISETPCLPSDPEARTVGLDLAVIVPTLNERANIPILVERLEDALSGLRWEVVFVDDDSRDGTAELVRAIAQRNRHVRVLQRIGRRGLASACIEGILATAAPVVAVMDADLQHDEALLPRMFRAINMGDTDLAIASRYTAGGSIGHLTDRRARISRFATKLSRLIVKADLADPMSGYFMVRREIFEAAAPRMSGQGFKILLDLFATSPEPPRFEEFPFTFRVRQHGESKLDSLVAWEYLMLIGDKMIGHVFPIRFISFVAIGAVGVLVNLATLWFTMLLGASFTLGEALGTFVAMSSNFMLNNQLTYRDRRLRGWGFLRGLVAFCVGCSVGALAGVGISGAVLGSGTSRWLAGLAGAAMGVVWNYVIASNYTWVRPARMGD